MENWYARLNRLKDYHQKNADNAKVKLLIEEMIIRLQSLIPLYTTVLQLRPKKAYKPGGVVNSGIAYLNNNRVNQLKESFPFNDSSFNPLSSLMVNENGILIEKSDFE